MKSLWNEKEAKAFKRDPLALRVYTSRLLGRESDLVLHGGGNTSVKAKVRNLFGETEEVLHVKGSGSNLETIDASGFAPVRMDALLKMAKLKTLSDPDMVKGQRAAMIDPYAPNPSVEAILHAIIPFQYVDHTHADAVITISNSPQGEARMKEIYGRRVLIVPYVMPGFVLARKVYEMTKGLEWKKLEGMVLMNHGIFSFAEDAKTSYERMIRLVSQAEDYLREKGARVTSKSSKSKIDLLELAKIRQAVSKIKNAPMLAVSDSSDEAVSFSALKNVAQIAARGPMTPDHIIRTKRVPVILGKNPAEAVSKYADDYRRYFKRYATNGLNSLDPAPRLAVWPGRGLVSFGRNLDETKIISDIARHTIRVIQQAEALGGWKPLGEKELFEVEYWDLEQAKLKKGKKESALQGKIALVTGAASGIGAATLDALHQEGAVVAGFDIDPKINLLNKRAGFYGALCDLRDAKAVREALEKVIRRFGGLDILVSNAGIFPPSADIAEMKSVTWDASLEINLTSHERVIQASIPYLKLGWDPRIVIVGSKNVPAPGPGASAYSVAKAGLTQLGRVAALELAAKGIRVNMVHPNQVFDTAIWTPEILKTRAQKYGVSVEEYKTSNLLKTEITSRDVAHLILAMLGPAFAKTTGAQVPIDGGNERVI